DAKDPDANLALGKYLAFSKGDWEKGLPHLALGKDEKLKALALQDLEKPTTTADQVKLADAWYDTAQEAPVKSRLQARAYFWYKEALAGATGLNKARIEKRLAELENVVALLPTTPGTTAPITVGTKLREQGLIRMGSNRNPRRALFTPDSKAVVTTGD